MAEIHDLFDQNELETEEMILAYKNYLITYGYAQNTIRDYEATAKLFLDFLQVDIKKLDGLHFTHFKSELLDKQKLKPSSVNKKLIALKNFSEWLYKHKYINKKIENFAKPIKKQKTVVAPKALTEKEINGLLQAAGSSKKSIKHRNYALIQLLLNTGVRVGELVALNYGHLEINERSGSLYIYNGKGNKERRVLVNAKCRSALREYFDHRNESEGWKPKADDPVFVSERKERMSIRAVQHTIKSLAEQSKITRIQVTPHVFRHTFATNYYNESKDIVGLSNLLGHNSLDTTSIYSLQSEEQMMIGLDKI
tara:strand:+ start:19105 stop:20034 length:930 start_codon:yes stop_codon:yes gene_type:complete